MSIPKDLIQRLFRAHNNAVKVAQQWEAATPGTLKKSALWIRRENAEQRFEAAVAAIIDASDRL